MRVPKQNPDADEVASLDTQPSDMVMTARIRCHRSGRVSSRGGTRARVDARTRRTRDRRSSVRQHPRRCRRSVFATPLEVRARGSVCEASVTRGAPLSRCGRAGRAANPDWRAVRSARESKNAPPVTFETALRSTAQGQIARFSFEFTHVRVGSAAAIIIIHPRCRRHLDPPRNALGFSPPRALAPTPRRPPCPRSGGRARGRRSRAQRWSARDTP